MIIVGFEYNDIFLYFFVFVVVEFDILFEIQTEMITNGRVECCVDNDCEDRRPGCSTPNRKAYFSRALSPTRCFLLSFWATRRHGVPLAIITPSAPRESLTSNEGRLN